MLQSTSSERRAAGRPVDCDLRLVSPEFLHREIMNLSAWAGNNFLRANGDPALHALVGVDGSRFFPHPEGAPPDRYTGYR